MAILLERIGPHKFRLISDGSDISALTLDDLKILACEITRALAHDSLNDPEQSRSDLTAVNSKWIKR